MANGYRDDSGEKAGEAVVELGKELLGTIRGKETTLDLVQRMDPALGKVARLEVAHKIVERPRAESQARAHTFHDAEGLIKYLGKHSGDNTVIMADVAQGEMTVTLDETAKDGVETCTFMPQVHPTLAPWVGLSGSGPVAVDVFVDFVRKNRRAVTAPDGKELALLFSQVRASTNITLDRGKGPKAVNGIMVEVNIQGQLRKEPVDLPETLTLRAPLYVGLPESELPADVFVQTVGDPAQGKIVVSVTLPTLRELQIAAFGAMVDELKRGCTKAVVICGSAGRDDWPRVEVEE